LPAAPDGFAESFQCDIESDLVSILETVGNGLRYGKDPERNPFDIVGRLAEIQRLP
jgi:hypothetical protein